jgi:hypothetical protein
MGSPVDPTDAELDEPPPSSPVVPVEPVGSPDDPVTLVSDAP